MIRWQHAISSLSYDDDVALAAAISACEKGWQWKPALNLLSLLHDKQKNIAAFNSSLSACEKVGQLGEKLGARSGKVSFVMFETRHLFTKMMLLLGKAAFLAGNCPSFCTMSAVTGKKWNRRVEIHRQMGLKCELLLEMAEFWWYIWPNEDFSRQVPNCNINFASRLGFAHTKGKWCHNSEWSHFLCPNWVPSSYSHWFVLICFHFSADDPNVFILHVKSWKFTFIFHLDLRPFFVGGSAMAVGPAVALAAPQAHGHQLQRSLERGGWWHPAGHGAPAWLAMVWFSAV